MASSIHSICPCLSCIWNFFSYDRQFLDFRLNESDQLLKLFYVVLLTLGILKKFIKELSLEDGLAGIFYQD